MIDAGLSATKVAKLHRTNAVAAARCNSSNRTATSRPDPAFLAAGGRLVVVRCSVAESPCALWSGGDRRTSRKCRGEVR
jgi:hypothetical protein